MKKFFIVFLVVIFIFLIGTILFLCYKNHQYNADFRIMFGADNFYIEEIVEPSKDTEKYTKVVNFCVPRSKYDKEFGTLEAYLNSLGYQHSPEEREGACWFFYNHNGDKVVALRSIYNNYLEWTLLYEKSGDG